MDGDGRSRLNLRLGRGLEAFALLGRHTRDARNSDLNSISPYATTLDPVAQFADHPLSDIVDALPGDFWPLRWLNVMTRYGDYVYTASLGDSRYSSNVSPHLRQCTVDHRRAADLPEMPEFAYRHFFIVEDEVFTADKRAAAHVRSVFQVERGAYQGPFVVIDRTGEVG